MFVSIMKDTIYLSCERTLRPSNLLESFEVAEKMWSTISEYGLVQGYLELTAAATTGVVSPFGCWIRFSRKSTDEQKLLGVRTGRDYSAVLHDLTGLRI